MKKALGYFTEAEIIAEKKGYKNQLVPIKNQLGEVYRVFSNYGEALGHYKEALGIVMETEPHTQDQIVVITNNIALVYHGEKNYDMAMEYYQRAYKIAARGKSDSNKVLLALNLADLYNELDRPIEAQKYLNEVKSLPKSKIFERGWKINYAESLMIEGRVIEARKIIDSMLIGISSADIDCYVCIMEVSSKVYEKLGRIDEAIKYTKIGLANTQEMRDKISLYDQASALYTKKKDLAAALSYKDSVMIAKDSMSGLINRGLFEANKVELKVQQYRNELQLKNERHCAERKIFIIGIIFCLLLCLFIYLWLRSRIIKQKQEKIISEKGQQILNLEMENLKNNIAEKNRRLSAKALYLSGRNELIEDIMDSLAHIPEVSLNKEIVNYMKTLKGYLKTDAEWDEFVTYFEQVNHNFFKILKERHPQLTAHDLRFLCYIYMNLDIKEISSIFSITSEAGRKRKQRIAKKMEIDVDDLHDYILKLT